MRAALLVSVLLVALLAALAFWPARAWAPPREPALKAPIVFDELVNPPAPAETGAAAPDPTRVDEK
jgi:hypothetical protein